MFHRLHQFLFVPLCGKLEAHPQACKGPHSAGHEAQHPAASPLHVIECHLAETAINLLFFCLDVKDKTHLPSKPTSWMSNPKPFLGICFWTSVSAPCKGLRWRGDAVWEVLEELPTFGVSPANPVAGTGGIGPCFSLVTAFARVRAQ